MKRAACLIVILLILISVLPITVFANSPPPYPVYRFELTNLPEGTQYVDMLIKLPTDDSKYVPLVYENLPDGFSENAQIVLYCEDDYRSYTFHYAEASSIIKVPEHGAVYFFEKDPFLGEPKKGHLLDVEDRGDICLALLDENGDILQVSKAQSLKPMGRLDSISYAFSYDAQADKLVIESRGRSPLMVALYIFTGLIGTILTCVVERLVARLFGLDIMYGGLILQTNIVSQILMRILYLPLYTLVFRRYAFAVVFLEVLIYVGEAFFYCWRMKYTPRKKVVLYTVVANTASLIFGLLIWSI